MTKTVTLFFCLFWLGLFAAAGAHFTHGFTLWTFEEVRREDAKALRLVAPSVTLETAGGEKRAVFAMPATSDRYGAGAGAGSGSGAGAGAGAGSGSGSGAGWGSGAGSSSVYGPGPGPGSSSVSDASLGPGSNADTVYLVDFIYTRCDSVCRSLGVEFHQMQEEIRRSRAKVQLLSISIDPVRDDPSALREYARQHGADAARWTLARPDSAATASALQKALRVIVIPDGFGGYVHNGAIHLIDSRGRLHGVFDYSDWVGALAAAEALAGNEPP